MPGDWSLDLEYPICGIDDKPCPAYLSRCDMCERNSRFEEILEEALNSVTLTEVESNGKLLKSKRTEYEHEYHDADSCGGDWREAYLYEYNKQKYIVMYKCTNFPFHKKECIRFGII